MLAPMRGESNVPSEPATTVDHSPEANDALRPLVLSLVQRRQIVQHLARWLPLEACGLIASVPDGAVDRAVHVFPGTNVDFSETRYTMSPREVIDAMRHMRIAGWELGAIVHSHPRSPATLSRTDLREAYYPDTRLIVVSFAGDAPEFGCWARTGDPEARAFQRSPLVFEER
jgi:proteasome lid subunit RPN8/RPN11